MREKRGQVTIFIIIAVVVVALVAAFYFLRPGVVSTTGFDEKNPGAFIQSCLEKKVASVAETLGLQGGSMIPDNYISYQSNNIQYLCYSSEYYKPCVVQQPMLAGHIESEIKGAISADVTNCFNELKSTYEAKAYTVSMTPGEADVKLLPNRIVVNTNYVLDVKKTDDVRYDSIDVSVNNNLYELSGIAQSIVESEAKYGDAESTLYMNYYRFLKFEKRSQQDGTTIYILTDRNTGDKLQFASRSIALPPGYGVGGIATG